MNMKLYVLSDGWPAYLHDDGTLTDSPDKSASDLGWDNLEQILEWDPDIREGTQEDWDHYAKVRAEHEAWIKEIGV